MNETEKWPLDFDLIEPGDVIPREKVESIVGITYEQFFNKETGKRFDLEALKLCGEIEKQLLQRGIQVVPKQRNGDIILQGDFSASSSVFKEHIARHARGLVRNLHRLSRIDTSRMSDEDKKSHERYRFITSKMVEGMVKGRKEAKYGLKAHQRNTPGIPQIESR